MSVKTPHRTRCLTCSTQGCPFRFPNVKPNRNLDPAVPGSPPGHRVVRRREQNQVMISCRQATNQPHVASCPTTCLVYGGTALPAPSSAPAPEPNAAPTAVNAEARPAVGSRYKWIALSNTTLGVLMVTINSSIVLIALPDIFRGVGINPLQSGNTTILLWMMMGFMVVTAVLVVSFGRLGDMFGRVRMFNMGFAIFSLFSILLSVSWLQGTGAGWYLIIMRILQGIGGAMLFANSSAILTDAFPANKRGMALGL